MGKITNNKPVTVQSLPKVPDFDVQYLPLSQLELHPSCELMPAMLAEEWHAFLSNVSSVGRIIDPIVVQTPATPNLPYIVLDGRHRLEASQILSYPTIPARIVDLPEEQQQAYALTATLLRRNLTEDQKAAVAIAWRPFVVKMANANRGRYRKPEVKQSPDAIFHAPIIDGNRVDSRQYICKVLGIPTRKFNYASYVQSHAPDLLPQVFRGELTLVHARKAAYKLLLQKQAAEIQQDIADQGGSLTLLTQGFEQWLEQIPPRSVDLIFANPPLDKGHLHLYPQLAELANQTLMVGGSLFVVASQAHLKPILDGFNHYEINGNLKFWWLCVAPHAIGKTRVHGKNIQAGYKPILWYVHSKRGSKGMLDDLIPSETANQSHAWQWETKSVNYIVQQLLAPVHAQTILVLERQPLTAENPMLQSLVKQGLTVLAGRF